VSKFISAPPINPRSGGSSRRNIFMPQKRDEIYTQAFAAMLKTERHRRKWSIREMAERCQVTSSGISAWERGHCAPTFGNLLKIAEVFAFKLSDMMAVVEHEASILEKNNHDATQPTVRWSGIQGECVVLAPANVHLDSEATADPGADRRRKSRTGYSRTLDNETSAATLLNLLKDLNMHTEKFAQIAGVHRATAFRWVGAQAPVPVSIIRMLELMRDKQNKAE
jgi:transcriptional regulator with XRE-family HTH domain